MMKENFIKLYENSFKENWALPALTDYGDGNTFSYEELAKQIARIHLLFEKSSQKVCIFKKSSYLCTRNRKTNGYS